MAVIGKLRERGKFLVLAVGGALVLFVIGELITGNKGLGGRGEAIGEIAGRDVNAQEFGALVEQQEDLYRQNGTTVDNNLQEQIRNSVWNDLLRQNTLMVQAENAGFGELIPKEEFDDIRFGNNILPDFKNNQAFLNKATGQVDKDQLRKYFKYIQENNPALYEMQKQTFVPQRIYAKYNTLVKKSCFVNSAQLKDEWAAKNTKATFTFVAKRYDSEPDSLYAVGDEDLRRYYDAHKNERKWRQKASRSFAFVRFPATPTQEDIEATRAELAQVKPELEAAKTAKADSALVVAYADTKNAQAAPYAPGTADQLNDSLIANADTGAVVGPFKDGASWKLVKIAELADVPEARVRHILFSTQGKSPDDEKGIKERADSVLAAVKKDKSKFEAMVTKYSEDPGSKNTGGVYEWFDKKRMVPEFTKASFDEKVGAITIAKTSFGYHIVEVLGQRTRKERRVITIDRKVAPVQAMKNAWKLANEFSLKNADSASFHKSAEEQGLTYTPVEELRGDQRYVPGLQNADEVVRWVDHAQPDAKPSEPLTVDESYVVCVLTGIREEGTPELKDVKEPFTKEVRKDKKAEALIARMNGKTDLNALATELGGSVQNAMDMTFNSSTIPGGFSDVPAVGQVFAVDSGKVSTPIKGDMAVYVVNMAKLEAAKGDMPQNADDRKQAEDRVRNRAESQCFNALKESAHVKDDRSKFY